MDMSAASAAGMQGQPSAFAYNYTGNISSMTPGGGMTPIRVSEDVRGSVDAALWGVGIQQLPDWEIQPEGARQGTGSAACGGGGWSSVACGSHHGCVMGRRVMHCSCRPTSCQPSEALALIPSFRVALPQRFST